MEPHGSRWHEERKVANWYKITNDERKEIIEKLFGKVIFFDTVHHMFYSKDKHVWYGMSLVDQREEQIEECKCNDPCISSECGFNLGGYKKPGWYINDGYSSRQWRKKVYSGELDNKRQEHDSTAARLFL